ncbi:MAG: methylmalonyl Co-A mutase-associated GTPase MeaB [Myxococcales bacterium]|nr:methylmalonyl Co-A mutase-associated GTPase MeaB [Myxococcales bacterium]
MSSALGPQEPSVDQLVEAILAGDRATIGRSITLVESRAARHRERAVELLTRLLPHSGGAVRLGITGVPGVGKSTFIESLGMQLIGAGRRVAVLAIDPSSQRSGGSIMGDKTRMERLANHPSAFVRPSPSGEVLGGVAGRTAEALTICEAAGFDVVIVETVGVGQSETLVAGLVDFFLVLMLPNAGDELQGIKRGVMELADLIVVNKADGENRKAADRARRQYASALKLIPPRFPSWRPPVLCASGLEGSGLGPIWEAVVRHRALLEEGGALARLRAEQAVDRVWRLVESELVAILRHDPELQARIPKIEAGVRAADIPPLAAALALVDRFRR